jgi:pilus assembly protein FimV
MSKRSRLPLALALALGSSPAWSLGLGQIEVKSALNQPLSAEIPVLSTQSGEADALVVRLAPPEALTRVGLPAPSGVAANLQFTVETNSRGQTVIRVTTPGKVSDPFVTFLIEVDWGQGKILREYTLLLDPPTMAPVRSVPRASAPVSAAPMVSAPIEPPVETPVETPIEAPPPPAMPEPAREPEPAATFEPVPEPEPAPAPDPAPAPESVAEPPPRPATEVLPPADPDTPRRRTDTYGPVASGETLWSIAQYARPDDSVSMNQMMLALLYANPDAFIDQNINRLKRGAVLRIPTREEALVVAAAEAAAQVRDQMQAWNQRVAPVAQPAEPETTDAPATGPVASRPTTQDSRLELVPPRADEAASGAQSGASVSGEGRELRAELARAREQVSTLSQENVELKSRVGELERIQGDSERLIALKDSELAAAQQRLAELEAREAEAAAIPPEPDAMADAVQTPAVDPAAGATSDPVAATPPEAPVEPPAEVVPDAGTPDAEPVAAPPPVETTPLADASSTTPLPERPAPTPWYMSPWVMGGGLLVVVGLLALLLGRRKSAAVAPSGRYGTPASVLAASEARDEEDEVADEDEAAMLAEAVARDPANLARHLELVRHYYDAGDAAGFEHAAEAMYARVYDPDDLAWKQVLAMGREIAPEHPLFVDHGAFEAPESHEPAQAHEPPPREIDWGATPAAASGATQQMRIDDVRPDYSTQAQPVLDVPEIEPSVEIESFNYESVPAESPSASVAEDAGYVDADAASTKLELARAYLDMGDVEGARGMLEEVVSEGNPGQRAEAKRLLDEIR